MDKIALIYMAILSLPIVSLFATKGVLVAFALTIIAVIVVFIGGCYDA